MLRYLLDQLKIACKVLILMSILTGVLYPILVWSFAQLIAPAKANGSLQEYNGKVIGSILIGQDFKAPKYFWGRPSATIPWPYNSLASKGSNYGPSNPEFIRTVISRVENLKKTNSKETIIPTDLVMASGSGLDPHISINAATYQIARIAKARKIDQTKIENLINSHAINQQYVNVLVLNLALDQL